jgi:phage repressor protein C with HTH and peptisase S24 domain
MHQQQNKALVARLKSLMLHSGLNARALAEEAGVGRSFVYDILSGKSTNPTIRKLSAIAEVMGSSVEYLLHGGLPLRTLERKNPQLVSIPSIRASASMGGGALVTDESEDHCYYFHRRWVREKLGASPANLRVLWVSGDSMNPTLQDHDLVLVDTSRRLPTPPGIFMLFDGMGLVVKRLESLHHTEPGRLRILSDNHRYSPYERSASEVNIVGKVVWFARTL